MKAGTKYAMFILILGFCFYFFGTDKALNLFTVCILAEYIGDQINKQGKGW